MLKQFKQLSCYLSLLIFALSLVACGGGGGGGTSTPPPPTTADSLIWDQGNWQEKNWN